MSTSDDDNEVGNFPSAVKPGHTNRCSHHMMNQPPPPCDNNSSPFMKEFSDGGSSSLSTKTCDRFGFFMDSDRAQSGADPDLNKVLLIREGLIPIIAVGSSIQSTMAGECCCCLVIVQAPR